MRFNVLTIVGVGLIGGSIGLAAKKHGLAKVVRGLGRTRATLEKAHSLQAIDEIHLDPATAVPGSDLVLFCTPVDQIASQMLDYSRFATPGTLFTDAGSTKEKLVATVEAGLPTTVHFVGSHPLAGSEKKGPTFAVCDLFTNRWTVLTPTEKTDADALRRITDFWQSLGSKVRCMTPIEHDRALAMTSHLPHLVASALAGILPSELFPLTATGFRDTTRIAAGDPSLWTAIFSHNDEAVLDGLARLMDRLKEFQRAIQAKDSKTLDELLTQAKKVRDALGS